MKSFRFEIHITIDGKQQKCELTENPIFMGSEPHCQVQLEAGSGIAVSVQLTDSKAEFKVLNLKYPLIIGDKKYKSAKLKKASVFKIGPHDIALTKIEVEEDVFEEYSDFDDDMPSIPNIPVETFLREEPKEESIKVAPKVEAKKENRFISSFDDIKFDTVFDESQIKIAPDLPYKSNKFDFSTYIELKDETVKEIPIPEIHVEQKGYSISVAHLNNGIVLNKTFFDTKNKRTYLSNQNESSNTIKVPEITQKKSEFIVIKNKKVHIVSQPGFHSYLSDGENLEEIDQKMIVLHPKQKIIQIKGSSQLIISLVNRPPKIKPLNWLYSVDRELTKTLALSWASVLSVFILMFLLVDIKKEKPKEIKKIVTIYKRQKSPVKDKKPNMPKKDMAKGVEQKKVVEKTAKKEPVKKKVAKKKPVKKAIKKVAKKKVLKKRPMKKRANIAKKAPVKVKQVTKKKSYSFNTSRSISSVVGTSKTNFNNTSVSNTVSVNSLNTSTSVSERSGANVGKTSTKVSRFNTGSLNGISGKTGTRGLSGKSDAATAYVEANTKILGALDPELIRKIMREYIPQFRFCYQRELVRNDKVGGVFDVHFQINAYGKGINTQVHRLLA